MGSGPSPQSRHVDDTPTISHGVMVVRQGIPVVPPKVRLANVILDAKNMADLFIASKVTIPDHSLEITF